MITIEFNNPANGNMSEFFRVYTLNEYLNDNNLDPNLSKYVDVSSRDVLLENLKAKCINLTKGSWISAYLVPMKTVYTESVNCAVVCDGIRLDKNDIATLTLVASRTFEWLKEHNFKPEWKTPTVNVQVLVTIKMSADRIL